MPQNKELQKKKTWQDSNFRLSQNKTHCYTNNVAVYQDKYEVVIEIIKKIESDQNLSGFTVTSHSYLVSGLTDMNFYRHLAFYRQKTKHTHTHIHTQKGKLRTS